MNRNLKLTAAGTNAAGPIPCIDRRTIRAVLVGANPHANEKIAVNATPVKKLNLRP
jgi:hypothetical protein